jgi:hypothetical protein
MRASGNEGLLGVGLPPCNLDRSHREKQERCIVPMLLSQRGAYMSGLAWCQTEKARKAPAPATMARSAENSTTCGWCHASAGGASEGSDRQLISESELRTSATRRSLVV